MTLKTDFKATLKDELKEAREVAKEIRLTMEERGKDPDVSNTILLAILQELREIKKLQIK